MRWPWWIPGWDLDCERPFLDHAPGAAAFGARALDPPAAARARAARLGAHELAEHAPRDLLEPAGAAAGRAGGDLAARLRAVSSAVRAGRGGLERNLASHAGSSFDEVDLDGRREIRTACASTAAAAAEDDVVAEEGREEIREVAEVDVPGLEAAAPQTRMAVAVVEVARLALRQHLVRLDHFAESLVRVRLIGHIGVELAREPPEGALDLRFARVAPDSEQLVVVAVGRGHRSECSVGVCRRNSGLVVDGLDEVRQLERSRAHGPERLLVVHPDGADEADGAERAMDEPVAGADERDLGESRVREIVSEADERTLRRARLSEHVDQVGPALDELEQAPVRVELLCADLAEEVGRAADVEALLGGDELAERGPERGEELALGRAEAGILEAAPEQARAELQPGARLRSGSRPPTGRARRRRDRRNGRGASRRLPPR